MLLDLGLMLRMAETLVKYRLIQSVILSSGLDKLCYGLVQDMGLLS